MNEVRLAAEESRRLQDVSHRSHRANLFLGVHIGEDRHADLATDFVEQFETGVETGATRRFTRAAIGLVVGGLEDVGQAEFGAHVLHVPGNLDAQLKRLGGAWAGNQEERPVEADVESSELHALTLPAMAARTKEENSG